MNYETTIELNGTEIEVKGYYQPEEKEVRYYSDGSGYPGCAAEFEIEELTIGGVDVIELLEDRVEKIEEAVLTKIMERYDY